MRNALLAAALATALSAAGVAQAKRTADVSKALSDAYPGATTEIVGSRVVNGVRVNDVKITTKDGESMAQVTNDGDFLLYGAPQRSKALRDQLAQMAQGVFKSAPKDIDLYRATSYYVDVPIGKGNKVNRVRLDAVGRILEIRTAEQMKEGTHSDREKASGKEADAAVEAAKKYVPDAKVQGVYKAEQGGEFYFVDFAGGEAIVTPEGQIFSYREEIKQEELPKPVLNTVQQMFNITEKSRVYRGEDEYFQFDQQTPTGEPVVVKMRPNGEIIDVVNDTAAQEEKAVTAKHKERAGKTGGAKATKTGA